MEHNFFLGLIPLRCFNYEQSASTSGKSDLCLVSNLQLVCCINIAKFLRRWGDLKVWLRYIGLFWTDWSTNLKSTILRAWTSQALIDSKLNEGYLLRRPRKSEVVKLKVQIICRFQLFIVKCQEECDLWGCNIVTTHCQTFADSILYNIVG